MLETDCSSDIGLNARLLTSRWIVFSKFGVTRAVGVIVYERTRHSHVLLGGSRLTGTPDQGHLTETNQQGVVHFHECMGYVFLSKTVCVLSQKLELRAHIICGQIKWSKGLGYCIEKHAV